MSLTVDECKQIILKGRRKLTEAEKRIAELEAALKANEGTRWHAMFGTPERAARTIHDACFDDRGSDGCGGCPAVEAYCGCGDYDKLLEWLRGKAVKR